MFKPIRIVAVLLTFSECTAAQSPNLTVQWEVNNSRYLVQRIGVADGRLDNVESIARGIRRENLTKELISLQFVTATSDSCFFDTKPFHLSFRDWARLFERCRNNLPDIAEVIYWRNGAVLRQRSGDQVLIRLLEGSNPLLFHTGSFTAEISFLAFPQGPFDKNRTAVHVFLTSPTLAAQGDMQNSIRAYKLISQTLPFDRVHLYIRSDDWFIWIPTFPAHAPFSTTQRSSPDNTVVNTNTVVCSSISDEICAIR